MNEDAHCVWLLEVSNEKVSPLTYAASNNDGQNYDRDPSVIGAFSNIIAYVRNQDSSCKNNESQVSYVNHNPYTHCRRAQKNDLPLRDFCSDHVSILSYF